MTRAATAVDRLVSALVGILLIAIGVLAVAWQQGRLPESRTVLSASPLVTAYMASWWLWALGVAAVVLIVLGLRWLVVHRPHRRVGSIVIDAPVGVTDSSIVGTLRTDLALVSRCAADSLSRQPGIVSATGRAVSDRGERVVEVSAVLDPSADHEMIAHAAQSSGREIAAALDGVGASFRILLSVSTSRRRSS